MRGAISTHTYTIIIRLVSSCHLYNLRAQKEAEERKAIERERKGVLDDMYHLSAMADYVNILLL